MTDISSFRSSCIHGCCCSFVLQTTFFPSTTLLSSSRQLLVPQFPGFILGSTSFSSDTSWNNSLIWTVTVSKLQRKNERTAFPWSAWSWCPGWQRHQPRPGCWGLRSRSSRCQVWNPKSARPGCRWSAGGRCPASPGRTDLPGSAGCPQPPASLLQIARSPDVFL